MLDGEDEFVFSGIVFGYILFAVKDLYMSHGGCLAGKGEMSGDGTGRWELMLLTKVRDHEVENFSLSVRQFWALPH